MDLWELIKKARSYRRFDENYKVSMDELYEIVKRLRFISSARNLQPLKYVLCLEPKINEDIFSTLSWAGYLKDWNGPKKGERPTAYIVILHDKQISDEGFVYYDTGIAIQTIMLSSVELGLGACPIAAINRDRLRNILSIDKHKEILCVMALGKPNEKIEIVSPKNGDIRYYRDENGVHYVPKRELEELIYKRI